MFGLEYVQFACIRAIINTRLYIRQSSWLSPATQPDRLKSCHCRPHLFAARIFIPDKRGVVDEKLPLVIRAHGGGFVVNNPSLDDPLSRYLADHARCIVVSIDYSKAPQSKFPAAYEDVVAQILEIIEDAELCSDTGQVLLSGTSAGGNLLLAASQDGRLKNRICGVNAIYAPVDFTTDAESKMATRPDPTIPDFIGVRSFNGIQPLYLDQYNRPSLADVRLSPSKFASRGDLPPKILLIGVEHDMFCQESEKMAEDIADAAGVEKVMNDDAQGWHAEGIRWHKILGQRHAFDNFPEKDVAKEAARLRAIEELYSTVSNWVLEICSDGRQK